MLSNGKTRVVSDKPKRQALFPLFLASDGERVRIVSIRESAEIQLKLICRSINIGEEIQVVRRKSNGSVVVRKSGSRYVLGGKLAMNIYVVPCRGDGKGGARENER
jgi:ferrous iron transport protein A